jgi:hypothetical protein
VSLFDWAGDRLKDGGSCDDIGPGIRPQTLRRYNRHWCVEPHGEYADWLEARGWGVFRLSALEHLRIGGNYVDALFLLDVIEHMERGEAEEVLSLAKKAAGQVVVFTPLGFYPQSYAEGEKDAWGMNGGHWQTHRSGWTPDDFTGWEVEVDPSTHEGHGAFFAIWTRP